MNLHIPIEIFDSVLIILFGMIWNGYRRMWRHIRKLELSMIRVMMMLQMTQGAQVPDERDTDLFRRANNLEGI